MANELAKCDDRGLELRTAKDVHDLAMRIVVTELCPKQYKNKPNDAMIAILAGKAVGLPPIQALRGIAVINGRPSMYGEDRTAVCLSKGQVEWTKEWYEISGKEVVPEFSKLSDYPDGLTACWQTKRRDQSEPSSIVRFRVADAKVAQLWGKAGPWQQYPARMLRMRARAWGERDVYADALAGIEQAEEVLDLPKRSKDPLEIEEHIEQHAPTDVQDAEVVFPAEPTKTPEYEALVAKWKRAYPGTTAAEFVKWCSSMVGHTIKTKSDWTMADIAKCTECLPDGPEMTEDGQVIPPGVGMESDKDGGEGSSH